MKYYILKESLDYKVIGGSYPQCQSFLSGYKNDFKCGDSPYYFSHFKGLNIDFTPNLEKFKFLEKVKPTDLISCPLGPGNDKVVSLKFYDQIIKNRNYKLQIFDCQFHKKNESFQYKWIHFVYELEKFVNYEKSNFCHPDEKVFEEIKNIKKYDDLLFFYEKYDTYQLLRSNKLVINFKEIDFFVIGRFNQHCYISERLKERIEKLNLVGFTLELDETISFVD